MKSRLSNIVTVVMVACAVLVTTVVVKREFLGPGPEAPTARTPIEIENWKLLTNGGLRLGPVDARSLG